MKSNIEFLYEQLRKETDGGSESMGHDDAIQAIRIWRDAYYAQKYPQPEQEPVALAEQLARSHAKFLFKAPQPQPEQEPVAWMHRSNYMHFMKEKPLGEIGFLFVPLYTAPQPQHNWEGLTEQEIEEIDCVTLHQPDWDEFMVYQPSVIQFARAIEAKLREKNS